MTTDEFPPAPIVKWWEEEPQLIEPLIGDIYSVTIHNKTKNTTTRLVGELEYVKETLAKWEDGK
jgi:hypothetical protein